ncbi:acyl-CoA dehydrogenase family protein [Peribacillus sp. SCS-37]|uniref:acyl-CoA dehydrogenase family protein n=1 Tax=Paraperibacillus esterisolvens TaxID=3115296 RepID=UPI0039066E41
MAGSYIKEEHQIFRKSLAKFLDKEARPHYGNWEENRLIPRGFWKKLGRQGYLCPDIPERYGGAGGDWGYSAVLVEELERIGSGLIGVSLHNDIAVPYITAYGTEEQKERWLPGCTTGDIITALAMTEPGAGSDLAGITASARKEGGRYILNGQKTFITNGIQADLIIVACRTHKDESKRHKGISLLAVEKDFPGFRRGRKLEKMGLHSQDTAELFFEECEIPAENVIGSEGEGFACMMDKLQQERLVVAIAAQTAAEEMLGLAMRYVKERQAFGKTISSFQHIQFKIAEMAADIEMGRTFLDSLVADHIEGKDIAARVSMGKWKLTELARKTAAECMQLHGGYGFMEEYEIARRYRDIPASSIYAGTNEIMKMIVAKNLGL